MTISVDDILSGTIVTTNTVVIPGAHDLVPSVVNSSKLFHMFNVVNQGSLPITVNTSCDCVKDFTDGFPITIPSGETYTLRLSILNESDKHVMLSQDIPARQTIFSF